MQLSARHVWIVLLVLLAIAAIRFVFFRRTEVTFPVEEHRVAGELLARVFQDRCPKDSLVLVVTSNGGAEHDPVLKGQLADFRTAIGHSSLRVKETRVSVTEARMLKGLLPGFEPGELKEMVAAHPGVAGVASFIGPLPRGEPVPEGLFVAGVDFREDRARASLAHRTLSAVVADVREPGLPPTRRNYQVLESGAGATRTP
jgi:hypothetical protein